MSNLNDIRDTLGKTWHNVADGWSHLYQRAKGSLTHFDNKTEEPTTTGSKRLNWGLLSTDLVDQGNEMVFTMEVPGLEKGDIEVQIHGDMLTVSGHKRSDNERTEGNYHIMECSYGSFQRSFHLPSTVDENQVDASYQNGVLSLKIPKKSTSEKIEIKVN